jgi:hypothetical protein
MVNLNTSRIATTSTGQNQTASFDDIANVARQSRGDGHIRMKSDGKNGFVIYGHRSDSALSIFHKSHESRQDAGTLAVARSIREFAAGKGTAVQEKAEQLLKKYVGGDQVRQRMTNSDVLNIHRQLNDLASVGQGVRELTIQLRNLDANNLISQFGNALGDIDKVFREVGLFSRSGTNGHMSNSDAGEKFKDVAYPELSGGVALAILQDIQRAGAVDPSLRKMLGSLFMPTASKDQHGPIAGRNENKVSKHFEEFDKTGDVQVLLGKLCDEVKNGWFKEESHYENSNFGNTARPLGGLRSPMFIRDDGAKQLLSGFRDKSTEIKLDSLCEAFTRHLASDVEVEMIMRFMDNKDTYSSEKHQRDPRLNSGTNNELVARSFEILLDIGGLTAN